MKNELIIKKCMKCGTIISFRNEGCSDITCCNETMQILIPNSTDAAFEKHVPTYTVEGDSLKVSVNHVMDNDHYIEWICLKTDEKEEYVNFKPGKVAVTVFPNVPSGMLYAYCNKHGLWSTEI